MIREGGVLRGVEHEICIYFEINPVKKGVVKK